MRDRRSGIGPSKDSFSELSLLGPGEPALLPEAIQQRIKDFAPKLTEFRRRFNLRDEQSFIAALSLEFGAHDFDTGVERLLEFRKELKLPHKTKRNRGLLIHAGFAALPGSVQEVKKQHTQMRISLRKTRLSYAQAWLLSSSLQQAGYENATEAKANLKKFNTFLKNSFQGLGVASRSELAAALLPLHEKSALAVRSLKLAASACAKAGLKVDQDVRVALADLIGSGMEHSTAAERYTQARKALDSKKIGITRERAVVAGLLANTPERISDAVELLEQAHHAWNQTGYNDKRVSKAVAFLKLAYSSNGTTKLSAVPEISREISNLLLRRIQKEQDDLALGFGAAMLSMDMMGDFGGGFTGDFVAGF